jgi:hypothetical protein
MTRLLAVALLAVLLSSPGEASDALAFVTEVKGKGQITHDGSSKPAAVGGQLHAGDELAVTEGEVVLIYLSGRTVTVEAGARHQVKAGEQRDSALMGRVMDTLGEITGPQSEIDRPVVHGMARDLGGLEGALPANTLVSRTNFDFQWDPLEGVESYELTIRDDDGNVVHQQLVDGTHLSAAELELQRGKRYSWTVQESGSFVPRSSGKSWVEVVPVGQEERLGEDIGCFFEAERVLVAQREASGTLTPPEENLLHLAYSRMERWDKLPEPEEESAGQPSGD